jgi:N-acetylmuramoyl-L-alanine amidase
VEHEKKFFGKDKAYSSNATVWDLTLAENREEARELADYICSTSSSGMCIKNRGVKSARFWVLKGTYMPSVLVEVGFVSNRQESRT